MSNPCERCRYSAYCLPEGSLPVIRLIKALRASKGFGIKEAKDYVTLTVPADCDWRKEHIHWVQSADPAVLQVTAPASCTRYVFNFKEDIPANTPVALDDQGRIIIANARQKEATRVLGILLEDVLAGVPVDAEIATHGIVTNALHEECDVPVGGEVFLGYMGGYTFSPPHQAARIIKLGYVLNDTDIWIQIVDKGKP